MPVLLGYQSARGASTPTSIRAGRRTLERFAINEGFALGDVFVEADGSPPHRAVSALVDIAIRGGAEAIAVPSAQDLGRRPPAQTRMRWRIEREAGIRVLIIPERG
jgi:hypothetical protein